MNILVINMTRFGDLIQSQPVFADIVQAGHRAGLVCLNNFWEAAALLQHISHVAPLPGHTLLHLLHSSKQVEEGLPVDTGGNTRWAEAWNLLYTWRQTLQGQFPYDVVCNLTSGAPARLLALFLAGHRPIRGFGMDTHGFGIVSSPWASFLEGSSLVRGTSPYNIVDLFRCIADGGRLLASRQQRINALLGRQPSDLRILRGEAKLAAVSQQLAERMREILQQAAPAGAHGYVGMQLGASHEMRRWPVASFVNLGQMVWEGYGLVPVLLGSQAEQGLAEEYQCAAKHPVIPFCGKTSLNELAAIIDACRLVVSNDTGTMHLAAGLGKQVLGIFLATAQPFDTGPYCAGSLSFEPDCACHPCAFGQTCTQKYVCHKAIKAELIFAYVQSLLEKRALPIKHDGARVWRAAFDEAGFMELQSYSGHNVEERTQLLGLHRHMLSHFLDRVPGMEFTLPFTEDIIFSKCLRANILEELSPLCMHLYLLVEQGHLLQTRPLPILRQKFMKAWEQVYTQLRKSQYFVPFAYIWQSETQAEGKDFSTVLQYITDYFRLFESVQKALNHSF